MLLTNTDTIVAISTPRGAGAIGVVRLSGPKAISIANRFFQTKNLLKAKGYSLHFGKIIQENGSVLDECIVSIYRTPQSYTREDMVEFSCHGSDYILEKLVQMLLLAGARIAEQGEFTKRAFLNGQLDLSQAEAVADLIAAQSASQHQMAINQLRGGISELIEKLRTDLIKFASLIELENDFGEEDVEFVDRKELKIKLGKIQKIVQELCDSFALGNAVKQGVPVAIVGAPNVGKSTLLNALLREQKAIVSPIPGTTRDVVEDTLQIEGTLFRFMDTAGLRETSDTIENMGIERTKDRIRKAQVVLFVAELSEDYKSIAQAFRTLDLHKDQMAIILLNKTDLYKHTCHQFDIEEAVSTATGRKKVLSICAKNGQGVKELKHVLSKMFKHNKTSSLVITNARHYQELIITQQHLAKAFTALEQNLPTDLIALDLRYAMNALGNISGKIYTDDLLDVIFRDFCIGK